MAAGTNELRRRGERERKGGEEIERAVNTLDYFAKGNPGKKIEQNEVAGETNAE